VKGQSDASDVEFSSGGAWQVAGGQITVQEIEGLVTLHFTAA
jgi:hypothetical protein